MGLALLQSPLLGHKHGINLVHFGDPSLKRFLILDQLLNILVDLAARQLYLFVLLKEVLNEAIKAFNDLLDTSLAVSPRRLRVRRALPL